MDIRGALSENWGPTRASERLGDALMMIIGGNDCAIKGESPAVHNAPNLGGCAVGVNVQRRHGWLRVRSLHTLALGQGGRPVRRGVSGPGKDEGVSYYPVGLVEGSRSPPPDNQPLQADARVGV